MPLRCGSLDGSVLFQISQLLRMIAVRWSRMFVKPFSVVP